ncbi:LysR family transcriptional regulator [Sinorhizobium medicae]|uniref:LysR family transcriptional regulator n=1 Tax=Sinorhizobium medicae TaxID=110321 RepID=UPI000FDBF6B8|nr:LysR family transcriptional regulator [Sinorhizobium medicae]RVO72941.1 LysR family transcriptional regulator [Sinorhizobium medicae]
MPIENQRDTVRDLTAFVAVARELSFTRAAAKLGVSQSALSYTIKSLEERLGVRLLTRTTRSVGLTEAGERLLGTAGLHLDGIEQALAGLSAFRGRPAGTVRIASSDHAAATVLGPVLARLLPSYPDVTVELVVDNAKTDIVTERCDAGVRLGEHLAHDMIAVRISPDQQMAVVATPTYLDQHGRPQTPDDLINLNCLAFRLETHGNIYAWEFEKDGKEVAVRPKGQIVCNDPDQITRFCLSGLGLACMQESYFPDALADGRLERVLEDWCPTFTGYYLYYPSRRQPTPAFTLILNALRREVT